MTKSIEKTLKAVYNDKFCDRYQYGGRIVFAMQDQSIEVENTRERVIKIRSSDVSISKDVNGFDQLAINTISKDNDIYDIISWQYEGNHREEIILIIEGDSRGN